jgi:hypothetical protein
MLKYFLSVYLIAMAKANDAPSFDDMESVTSNSDEQDEIRGFEPGEAIVCKIRHREKNVGRFDNTVLHITLNTGEHEQRWSNDTIESALDKIDPDPDEWVGIEKDEETYPYETDDGEQGEAYGFDVRQMPTDGDD